MPRAARAGMPAWAKGLSIKECSLAQKHGLFRRPGTKLWWCRIKGLRESTGTEDLTQAVESVTKKRHDRWLSEYMGVKPKRTWQEAVEQRAKEVAQSMASWTDEQQRLRWWHPYLGTVKDLNEITREMIAGVIEKHRPVDLSGPASCNTTANKYVRVVQTILNAAERKWGWGNRAPILKAYQEGLPRDACPSPYEVLRLCEVLPAHSADMAAYSAMTLHRRANVTGLKWSMIDWEKRAVQIAGRFTKTGKLIYVPLNSVAMGILKRRFSAEDRHPEWVFHYRGQRITQVLTKSWRAARTAVDMPTVAFHTMRHCGQSWLAQLGVSAEMRARLGGWSVRGLGAMDSYTHLYIEDLRPIAEKLAEQWKAAVSVRAAKKQAEEAIRAFGVPSTVST
jgi:hypothetical protein